MDKINSPLLISPKNLNELFLTMSKYPNAQLFAGGTYIMSRMGYYPNPDHRDIISLAEVAELSRILHVERFIEFGAMVTLKQMLSAGAYVFSKELYKAIEDIGTGVLRNQITVGGALCTPGIRFALSCILSVTNAMVEVRVLSKRSTEKKAKTLDRWIPVSGLYNQDGDFIYEGRAVITRIRIPIPTPAVQFFKTVGDPMSEPSNTVIMGLTYSISQEKMTLPSFCLVLPKGGFFCTQEFNNILSKVTFPLSTKTTVKLSVDMDRCLSATCEKISAVQRERAKRLLLSTLYSVNSAYLER